MTARVREGGCGVRSAECGDRDVTPHPAPRNTATQAATARVLVHGIPRSGYLKGKMVRYYWWEGKDADRWARGDDRIVPYPAMPRAQADAVARTVAREIDGVVSVVSEELEVLASFRWCPKTKGAVAV